MTMRAVVTAGSASSEVDTVRRLETLCLESLQQEVTYEMWNLSIRNIFKGEMGCFIANSLAERGVETTLILREESIARLDISSHMLKVLPFRTFVELERTLWQELEAARPDMVVMSAAPPDYSPVRIEGKIPSHEDALTIHLKRNPKLLDGIRERVGAGTIIAGFKLAVSVTNEWLDRVGKSQIERAQTDLCVENDMSRFDFVSRTHPVRMQFRDGSISELAGGKRLVAQGIADVVVSLVPKKDEPHQVL